MNLDTPSEKKSITEQIHERHNPDSKYYDAARVGEPLLSWGDVEMELLFLNICDTVRAKYLSADCDCTNADVDTMATAMFVEAKAEVTATFAAKLNDMLIDKANSNETMAPVAFSIPVGIMSDLLAWAATPGNVLHGNDALQATLAARAGGDETVILAEFAKLNKFWKAALIRAANIESSPVLDTWLDMLAQSVRGISFDTVRAQDKADKSS